MMRVVIFSPNDSFSPESLPVSADTEVTVVRWAGQGHDDAPGRITVRSSAVAARIVAAASRSILARTFLRATPLDTGARFWRATRNDDAVRAAVRQADLIVAPERDGGYAAWNWHRVAQRKGRTIIAVAGYPAARASIEQRR